MGRVRRPSRADIIEALELSYTLLQEMPGHAAQGKTIAKLLAEERSAEARECWNIKYPCKNSNAYFIPGL